MNTWFGESENDREREFGLNWLNFSQWQRVHYQWMHIYIKGVLVATNPEAITNSCHSEASVQIDSVTVSINERAFLSWSTCSCYMRHRSWGNQPCMAVLHNKGPLLAVVDSCRCCLSVFRSVYTQHRDITAQCRPVAYVYVGDSESVALQDLKLTSSRCHMHETDK